jgi:hypothetical protein
MRYHLLFALALGLLLAVVSGCSDSNPMAPVNTNTALEAATDGDPVMFAACVATADQARRMLTFMGIPDTVIAAKNCEIVRLNGGSEAPIPFSDMKPTDSVHVQGVRQQNGYVIAHRLQVRSDGCFDLAFRDTIVEIDYAAGTFTVAGRSEVIQVDDQTLIWGSVTKRQATFSDRYEYRHQLATPAGTGPTSLIYRRDATIAFTDLQPGDVVEVKANILTEEALLAVAIKLTNCSEFETRCVKFEATIATLDIDLRIVTFTDLAWIGTVCNGAQLLDADGLPIALDDFSVGDAVAVKGLPLEADSLRICRMTKL